MPESCATYPKTEGNNYRIIIWTSGKKEKDLKDYLLSLFNPGIF
jgi:hypothetical protein